MPFDLQAKKQEIAAVIGGQVIDDTGRVAVCIKGSVQGLPATLEAIYPTWPFGVMYTVESNAVVDPNKPPAPRPSARISLFPRFGRGFASFFSRVILFESGGLSVGDKKLEGAFSFTYDNQQMAERFVHYPGVRDLLFSLEHSRFSEAIIQTDAGIYISQPINFKSLPAETCRTTFKVLAEIARVLNEAF